MRTERQRRRVRDHGAAAWLIDRATRALSRLGLDGVYMAAVDQAIPGPVLYCANHVSWWDGFLVRRLHQSQSGGPLYTIMLDSELSKRPILARAGAVGLVPGSLRSVRTLLRLLEDRASHPSAAVALYPQGRIWPSTRRPLGFEQGVRLFAGAMGAPAIVPVALHLEPLNRARPSAFVLQGRPLPWDPERPTRTIELLVEELLDQIHGFLAETGEDAPTRWRDWRWKTPAQTTNTDSAPSRSLEG